MEAITTVKIILSDVLKSIPMFDFYTPEYYSKTIHHCQFLPHFCISVYRKYAFIDAQKLRSTKTRLFRQKNLLRTIG